ncbi:MAG: hypothetical protein GYA59_05125 [Chloroflexi bacterium]|nr:hypothetical protein [Chloroflexota bacterium]
MAEDEKKKKSIFDQAVDALSSRDEKAAAEAAQKAKEDAEKARAEAEKRAAEAEARAAEAEKKAVELAKEVGRREAEDRQRALEEDIKRRREDYLASAPPQPKVIAEHKLEFGETFTHLALKYYGHATEPYWKVIVDFNRDILPEDIRRTLAGTVIRIPELPEELKKKK